jgi:hypothetical protein
MFEKLIALLMSLVVGIGLGTFILEQRNNKILEQNSRAHFLPSETDITAIGADG